MKLCLNTEIKEHDGVHAEKQNIGYLQLEAQKGDEVLDFTVDIFYKGSRLNDMFTAGQKFKVTIEPILSENVMPEGAIDPELLSNTVELPEFKNYPLYDPCV